MTKFHVEFDANVNDLLADEFAEDLEISYGAENVVITEIQPKTPGGWYVRTDFPVVSEVYYFTEDELEDVNSDWSDKHMRVNPPTPYVEEKYTDGYYWSVDYTNPEWGKSAWRRLDGVWSWKAGGGWIKSTYTDEDIEQDQMFVPED